METDELLIKVELGEQLSERELIELTECEYRREEGDDRRWLRSVSSYIKLENSDRIFCVDWEQGLTENQENEYYSQPYEVVENIEERVVQIYNYTRV